MKKGLISISKSILILVIIMVFGFGFRPITEVENEPTKIFTCELKSVNVDSTTNDIQLRLANSNLEFYINRGAHNQLLIDVLDANLERPITITYVNREDLISSFSNARHVCKVQADDSVFYSEFKTEN